MAAKPKAEHGDPKRSDVWAMPPYDLKLKGDNRGRHIPPTEEQMKDMALSLLTHNQQETIQGRKMRDGTIFVTAGFTRTGAGRMIVDGFTDNDGVAHDPDPEFKIWVKLVQCNDRQAFVNNIVENAHRNYCTPIDDAHNHNKCREQHGMSDAEIARLYQYKDTNKVGRLKKLLFLEDEIQNLVHFGQMGVTAALDLLDVPQEAQAAIVAASTAKNGKINGASIREEVRDKQLEDADVDADNHTGPMAEESDDKKYKARTMKEMRTYFDNVKEYSEDEEVIKFAKITLLFLSGKKTKKQMDNALFGLRNAEVLEEVC